MRDLTDNEKNIVENLLRLKRNHDLAGLQTAKILEQKSSNFLTIKWVSKDKHSLSIYYNANDANDEVNKQNRQKAFERYFEICDYLYFVRELVENKMVAIQTVFSKDPDKDIKILCNKKYITYKEKEDKFYLNSQLNSNITEELKPLTALHWSSQNIYTAMIR